MHSKIYMATVTEELINAINKPNETVQKYSMEVLNEIPPPNTVEIKDKKEYYRKMYDPSKIVLRYERTSLTQRIQPLLEHLLGWKKCLLVADYILNLLGPWCVDRLWSIMLESANTVGLIACSEDPVSKSSTAPSNKNLSNS